jgi:phosphate starvation-inducible protein PhoH and related proteins
MRLNEIAHESAEVLNLPVSFDDNALCARLFGHYHRHLARIEQKLPVSLVARGNQVLIQGTPADAQAASAVLHDLYQRLERGHEVGQEEVDASLRMVAGGATPASPGGFRGEETSLRTERRLISPRSPNQAAYLRLLDKHALVLAVGPAGTGKTYLAVAAGAALLRQRRVDRLILSRPAVEAGERLGFLPGDLKEKVDPYLRPLYDALHDMLPEGKLQARMEGGQIEVAPLAFMRGRTLANAFVILDEAQNTTPAQMKMFLTRLGENARMVVTGDPSQTDLPDGQVSGLEDALDRLEAVPDIGVARFTNEDIVRHPLVTRILQAYDAPTPAVVDQP